MIYLGIDIGTTSAKCLAVGESGEVLGPAQRPYALSHPQQGWAEQDPEDYWRALVDVVRRCVSENGLASEDVVSLALSTQGDTLIVTDDAGRPLLPAMSWMDARAEEECRGLLAETGPSFWYREMGQPLTPLSSACKIRWIERHRPDIWKQARFCWVADFLAKRLCGRFIADVPSASWTPIFSPSKRAWSKEAVAVLGIPESSLPEVAESGELIGELVREAAKELRLTARTRLIAGAFDQAAAAHGAGATPHGRSVLSCGTAWVLYSVADRPVLDENEHLCICCHVKPDQWGLVLPFTGGSAYDWLQRTMGAADHEIGSSSDPLTFIPHLYGGLSPDWRQESRGAIFGLTMSHTPADIRLALMRGIAFEARRNLEAGEALTGRIETIRMVGGAGKSEVWPQLIANILDRPVEVSELLESACYGAARLAAGEQSTSWVKDQSVKVCTPAADEVSKEDALYRKYLRLYEALLEVCGP